MGLGNDVGCMSLKLEFLLLPRTRILFFLHEKNIRLHMMNRISKIAVPATIAAATIIAVGRSGPVEVVCVLVGPMEGNGTSTVDEVGT